MAVKKESAKPTAKKPAAKKAAAKKPAAKKVTLKKLAPKKAAPRAKKALFIDYPAEGESIFCGHYSMRLGSPEADVGEVKISINGGDWQDCRPAHGYWWFDWWNFELGAFHAEACALINGKETKTGKRKFKVTL